MSDDTNGLGKWGTTLGGVISTLAPTCDKYVESDASVFGNSRHNAVIQVKLKLGDSDGKALTKSDPVSPAAVKRSIKLGNYDDTNGFVELGGGVSTGWKIHANPSVFLYPPQQGNGDLPTISPHIYYDGPDEDNLYCIHFFVSYDETLGNGPGSFEMGIKVEPKDLDDIPVGKPYTISKTCGGDPYTLLALKSLSLGADDFEWTGTRVRHEGQSDEYISPSSSDLAVNYFREIAYTIELRDANTYTPPINRYGSRIFRCGIDDGHTYSPNSIKGYKNYSFGVRKNNFYSFRGYFWPYNVYKESLVTIASARPLVPAPTNPDAPNSNFRMMADGLTPTVPTFSYDPHKLNLSLYASFGFTSNDYDQSCPLDINIYDQYGHKADLAVDPDMLPREYIDPESENGLCSYKYFSTKTEIPDFDDQAKQHNVYGIFVAKLPESGRYRYIAADEIQGRKCTIVLKDTPDDKLPAFDKTNLFRTYRTVKTNNEALPEINYSIVSYEYPSVEWAAFGPHVITVDTIQETSGWRLSPVWINTSFTIFYPTNLKVVTSDEIGGNNGLGLKDNPTGSAALEWDFVVCADNLYIGQPDQGQGPNEAVFSEPNFKSGRNYWVTINSLKMTFNGGGTTGYIYPNGRNQAEIEITIIPGDAKGQMLDSSQFPLEKFVRSCIVAADYHSGQKFKREIDAPGWDYSFVENQFLHQTLTQDSIVADYDSIDVSVDKDSQSIVVKMYVTAEKVTSNSKDIGLWIGIHDEVWGDPIVYTCKADNSGGDTFNFNTFVTVNLKNPVNYTDHDLLVSPVNASMANRSDSWPVSANGAEIDDNMWRLWNFSIGLNGAISPLFFAVDTTRYSKDTRRFSIRSWGVYTASTYIWPTGLVDMETLEPISESSTKSFSVDSVYSVNVENSPDTEPGKLFMSMYWEFGSDDYFDTVLQNYFTIVVYDVFGNTGTFNPESSLIPDVYDEGQIKEAHPLNIGPAVANNKYFQNQNVVWSLISKFSGAGESRYVSCVDYSKGRETYDVNMLQKTPSAQFFLQYGQSKSYQFLYALWNAYGLGSRYGDQDFKMFAGLPQSSRFYFFLRPLWNQKAFLIAVDVPRYDTQAKGFAYLQNENPKLAELKDIQKGDDSFIWSLEFY